MATEETANSVAKPHGGVVKPVYSERTMRCLTVTESELKQIGLANIGVTVFVGIGSALLSFGIDVFKDTALTPPDAASTGAVADSIERLCIGGGIICYLIAAVAWFWRRDMIATIKRESEG